MNRDQFESAMGCNAVKSERFYEAFAAACDEFGIDSPRRIAAFLAQVRHESAGLARLEESLNYNWEALRRVWPRRFPSDDFARHYHRQPERIANLVYCSRMGNGPLESGDGWKYRGRGPIQITGRANYEAAGFALGYDLLAAPECIAREADMAARSAAWFWHSIDGNRFVDCDNFEGLCRRINGGAHGMVSEGDALDHAG